MKLSRPSKEHRVALLKRFQHWSNWRWNSRPSKEHRVALLKRLLVKLWMTLSRPSKEHHLASVSAFHASLLQEIDGAILTYAIGFAPYRTESLRLRNTSILYRWKPFLLQVGQVNCISRKINCNSANWHTSSIIIIIVCYWFFLLIEKGFHWKYACVLHCADLLAILLVEKFPLKIYIYYVA